MAQRYTFYSSYFPNNTHNSNRLITEVQLSDIVVALNYIDTDSDGVYFWFEDTLSYEDWATLSGIVSTHNGQTYVPFSTINREDVTESSTSSPNWQDKLVLTTTSGIMPRTCKLSWTYQLWSGEGRKKVEARIYNSTDDDVIQDVTHIPDSRDQRSIYSGFKHITVDENPKVIKIQWRANDVGNPVAHISEARINLEDK